MLDKKVSKLLNEQINNEFYSAYLYLDFANYFEAKGLDGFANWYKIQAQEERDHAMLFYQFLQNNSEKVTLEAIGKSRMIFAKAPTTTEIMEILLKPCAVTNAFIPNVSCTNTVPRA